MTPDEDARADELLDGITADTLKRDMLKRLGELAGALAIFELATSGGANPAHPPGLIPMAYYVGGAEHRGTLVQIHRCTPRGESGEEWVVQHGVKMYTKEGHPMPFRRWSKLTPALRARTAMPFDEALKVARSKLN